MLSGLHLAKPFLAAGMTQETINAVLGKPVGLPPTGLYGLVDLIGLDVMDLVGKNLAINLPANDAGHAFTAFPAAEHRMLERGQLGRKARDHGGFGRVQNSTMAQSARKRLISLPSNGVPLLTWTSGVSPVMCWRIQGRSCLKR